MTADLIFTAAARPGGKGRIHRATCRHLPKTATPVPVAEVTVTTLRDANRATCCSPKAADVETALYARIAAVRAATDAAATAQDEAAADAATGAQRCTGACGAILPIRKFPTKRTKNGIGRGTECRACRDARYAAKAAAAGRG